MSRFHLPTRLLTITVYLQNPIERNRRKQDNDLLWPTSIHRGKYYPLRGSSQLFKCVLASIQEFPRNLPGGPVVKNPPANAVDMGLIPDPGRLHMPCKNQKNLKQVIREGIPLSNLELTSGSRDHWS